MKMTSNDVHGHGDDGRGGGGSSETLTVHPGAWRLPALIGGVVAVLVVVLGVVLLRDDSPPPPPPPPPVSGPGDSAGMDSVGTSQPDAPVDTEGSGGGSEGDGSLGVFEPEECSSYVVNESVPVAICDRGENVRLLQQALRDNGYDVVADGFYGPLTHQAVAQYQFAQGLEVNGVAGDITFGLLVNVLTEPDGGEESVVPAGIVIDGQPQQLLYNCFHYPFQSVGGGVGDAHVVTTQYLVADPSGLSRQVVEVWRWDEVASVNVHVLGSGEVGSTEIAFEAASGRVLVDAVPVTLTSGRQVSVTVGDIEGLGESSQCDTMFVIEPWQVAVDTLVTYGVTDVCRQDGFTVVTFNTWEIENGDFAPTAPTVLTYSPGDDGLASGSFISGGELLAFTGANWGFDLPPVSGDPMGAEIIDGVFNESLASFALTMVQHPQVGHDCVPGQHGD